MLTAEVGLRAVPHVLAPAGVDELARGAVVCDLPAIAEEPIVFVPGVRLPAGPGLDGWAEADVMRGEECETLGAWIELGPAARGTGDVAFLWPGSHTKLVAVDGGGRIVASQTTLAGEILQTLARQTLLAASLPAELPEAPDAEAVDAGARLVARHGLGRAAFLVRVAALTSALDAPRRAAFWIGAVVADDVAHLVRHPILRAGVPVWVGGREPLRSLYARLLARHYPADVAALGDRLAEGASALGALAVARRHAFIG
jgi:2-dehydro-3-deoxygalactonokinase